MTHLFHQRDVTWMNQHSQVFGHKNRNTSFSLVGFIRKMLFMYKVQLQRSIGTGFSPCASHRNWSHEAGSELDIKDHFQEPDWSIGLGCE